MDRKPFNLKEWVRKLIVGEEVPKVPPLDPPKVEKFDALSRWMRRGKP